MRGSVKRLLSLLHLCFITLTTSQPPTPESFVMPLSNGRGVLTNQSSKGFDMLGDDFPCGIIKGLKSPNPGYPHETTDVYTPCVVYPNQVLYSEKKSKIESACRVLKCLKLKDSKPGKYKMDQIADVLNFKETNAKKTPVRSKVGEPRYDTEMHYICDEYTFDDVETQLAIFNDGICQVNMNPHFFVRPRYRNFRSDSLFRLYNHFYGRSKDKYKGLRAMYGIDKNDFSMDGREFMQCDASCSIGNVFKYTMLQDMAWRLNFFVHPNSTAIKLCFNATGHGDHSRISECHPEMILMILPQNNMIIWPYNRIPSKIRFGTESNQDGKPTMLQFQVFVIVDGGSNQIGVLNRFNEVVVSQSNGYSKKHLQRIDIFLSNETTLVDNFGIVGKNVEVGFCLVKKGTKVVHVKPGAGSGEKVTDFDGERIQEIRPAFAKKFLPVPSSTTPTPEVVYVTDSYSEHVKSYTSQFANGKWLLFAILMGFIAGTLAIVILGGIVSYTLRRTIYSVWYRAMFKRYGCDASGSTGGLTGIGFGPIITQETIANASTTSTIVPTRGTTRSRGDGIQITV
ncbi:unnamed protein product [Caenorhabditis bovis]|uniref:Glycoprotein n=1 Tax=Caenorhabditis bovis TaxID=2654633 RepID=A0A8S1EPJ5_9PELO|nr:unnamed protein product [Caenorhabditis bovis]